GNCHRQPHRCNRHIPSPNKTGVWKNSSELTMYKKHSKQVTYFFACCATPFAAKNRIQRETLDDSKLLECFTKPRNHSVRKRVPTTFRHVHVAQCPNKCTVTLQEELSEH